MAFRPQQQQQQPMPFQQMQVQAGYNNAGVMGMVPQRPVPMMSQITRNMMMPGQANIINRNFQQQMPYPAPGTKQGQGRPSQGIPKDRTLEVVEVAGDMGPRTIGAHATHLSAILNQQFDSLTLDDKALLQTTEVFTFAYRHRKPHEPNLMRSAAFYYKRLESVKSQMCERIHEVSGFRCVGCKHTANDPDQYIVGAAQLVSSDYFVTTAVVRSLLQLKIHMQGCSYIQNGPVKDALALSSKVNGKENGNRLQLELYIANWIKALESFRNKFGFPKISPFRDLKLKDDELMKERLQAINKVVDPSIGALSQALGSIPQRQSQVLASLEPDPAPESVYTEEELLSELESVVVTGLVANNFGVARIKPRIIAANLSNFPMTADHEVSPLLELLLQSLCAVQRWTTQSATNGNHDQELGGQKSEIFFECNYCRETSHCATGASPRAVADFIVSSTCDHLCEDCEKVPATVRAKLEKMNARTAAEQRFRQKRIIEKSFDSWKSQFPETKKRGVSKKTVQFQAWRPLTWKFIEENGKRLADESLAPKEPSVFLRVGDETCFPFPLKDNDVLFGWSGKHLGNSRFLNLLHELGVRGSVQNASPVQLRLMAFEAAKRVADRKGLFYSVASNPLSPPNLEPPERILALIIQLLKRGNVVLNQPPSDLSKRGRGSCVLECESAPQRSLHGIEIVRNKRFKKAPAEDG